jgi:hypothetical protein
MVGTSYPYTSAVKPVVSFDHKKIKMLTWKIKRLTLKFPLQADSYKGPHWK